MQFFNRIFTTPLLLVAILATSFGALFIPQKAGAAFGVGDLVFDPAVDAGVAAVHAEAITTAGATTETAVSSGVSAVQNTVTAVSTTGSFGQQLLEWGQSFVAAVIKRQILDVLVDQIVTWIQGGGEPKFITDWGSFMGNIAQGAVGDFVQNVLGAGFLCEPFSLKLRIGLLPVQKFGGGGTFSCTLDKIVGNINNFYDDFRNGGWIAYDAAWQPQNNYYGALLIAWDAQNNYVADKVVNAANEAISNSGFLSTKKCYGANGDVVPDGTRGARCETVTPGKLAGDAVSKALGSDIDFIVNADQIGEYVAAIVNALVNRVIMEGVNGLRGVHSSSGGTYAPSGNSGATSGGFRTTSQVPGNIRTEISSYTQTSSGYTPTTNDGGGASASRAELISNITTAITTRTALNETLTATLALEEPIITANQDAMACQADIISRCPTCQPSITPPDWPARRTLQQGRLDNALLTTQPLRDQKDRNDQDLMMLRNALAQLNALTDAQYVAQQTNFIATTIASKPSLVNILLPGARLRLSRSQQNAPATLLDVQRDGEYCRAALSQLPPR